LTGVFALLVRAVRLLGTTARAVAVLFFGFASTFGFAFAFALAFFVFLSLMLSSLTRVGLDTV
jgi:hypothetical protein